MTRSCLLIDSSCITQICRERESIFSSTCRLLIRTVLAAEVEEEDIDRGKAEKGTSLNDYSVRMSVIT
jgi:hypothetical protein